MIEKMEDDLDMPAHYKALRESERMMRELLEPPAAIKAMQESERMMRELLEPPAAIRAMQESGRLMRELLEPPAAIRAMQESERMMRALLEPPAAIRAMRESERLMRELLEPPAAIRAMQESERMMRALLEPSTAIRAMQESERLIREMLDPPATIKVLMKSERMMREMLGEPLLNRLATVAGTFTGVTCNINPDGSIVGNNSLFDIRDVKRVIDSCIERTPPSTTISFEMRVNDILDNAARQHPVIAKIIIFILLPIIINLYTSKYFSESTIANHNHLVRQIKKEVQKKPFDRDLIKEYRFVSSSTLNVRSNNSTKSKVIGKLYFGDTVQIIEKKKNWSLVQHAAMDGEIIISGWVFTRYIHKFN